jgi:hypothetical protein
MGLSFQNRFSCTNNVFDRPERLVDLFTPGARTKIQLKLPNLASIIFEISMQSITMHTLSVETST